MLNLLATIADIAKKTVSFLQKNIGGAGTENIFIVGCNLTSLHRNDLLERLGFYLPDVKACNVRFSNAWPLRTLLSQNYVLVAGSLGWSSKLIKKVFPEYYNVDFRENPTDGWEWVRLVNIYYKHHADINASHEKFSNYVYSIKKQGLMKCYLFGTGSSLEEAQNKKWDDGYRVVCNTIVRDEKLWGHINPHFIVAGDAIYHFGHTSFARAFRADLAERLRETKTLFVYPELFDAIVRREFAEFSEKLIPVPKGAHNDINVNLLEKFCLPALGNVLALLLLPIGATLSRNIMLWGFDGRSPNDSDKPFWSNSSKHTYEEYMHELLSSHPKFFDYFVPQNDQNRYVKQVHGDLLDERLSAAEKEGFCFTMMHDTWTETLQKRINY